MGRPVKKLDENQIKALAEIQCTYSEIAAVMGCSKEVLHRRFQTIIKEAAETGKSSLRRAQYKAALNGNASMLIWLGKQLLDQKDTPLLDQSNHQHITVVRADGKKQDLQANDTARPIHIQR